jgi:enoyl-CoA hydratase
MTALLYEKRGPIAYLTLNRPERRNAIDAEMACRLADAWLDYEADDGLRCAILTGAGSDTFTAGADLGTLIPLLTRAREPESEWDKRLMGDAMRIMGTAILSDYSVYKPIIMAVNGLALAGGTEILHPADIRLAVPHAVFGLPEVKRAVFPGASLARLPRSIAYSKAMEMLLVGDPMSAEEAWRVGWINEVVPAERLMDRAQEIASKIADKSPESIRLIKQGVIQTSGMPLATAHQTIMQLASELDSAPG